MVIHNKRHLSIMEELNSKDPKAHTRNIRSGLQEVVEHLKRDIEIVDEPQAKALFETSAEVLTGLITAYKHYEEGDEEAWNN